MQKSTKALILFILLMSLLAALGAAAIGVGAQEYANRTRIESNARRTENTL